MPRTVNEKLQAASISHQVDLQQLNAGVVRRIIQLLNRTDADLTAQLRAVMDKLPPGPSLKVERLDALLESVRTVNRQAYTAVGERLNEELRQFTGYELMYQNQLFATTLPGGAPFTVAAVTADQVYAAAVARPFQGRLLSEWMSGLEADRAVRIRDAVRMGYLEGQTSEDIVRRIRGTRAGKFQDGIMQIDRRNAEAVARTALSHIAESVRESVFASNSDIIKEVVWHSTLDGRTSTGCQIRDNKRYHPVSHKPIGHSIPWLGGPGRLHWRCRSASYPVTKSWKELGLPMDDMDAGTRASMDGQVPADLSYGDWLRKQSAARQDEIVGPARGKLMREGKMPFDALYTNRGEMLTLEQLQARDAAAFKRAGLG